MLLTLVLTPQQRLLQTFGALQPGGAAIDPAALVVTPRNLQQLGHGPAAGAAPAAAGSASAAPGLMVLDAAVADRPVVARPVQSFEQAGSEPLAAALESPLLVVRRLPGVVRKDRAERLSVKDAQVRRPHGSGWWLATSAARVRVVVVVVVVVVAGGWGARGPTALVGAEPCTPGASAPLLPGTFCSPSRLLDSGGAVAAQKMQHAFFLKRMAPSCWMLIPMPGCLLGWCVITDHTPPSLRPCLRAARADVGRHGRHLGRPPSARGGVQDCACAQVWSLRPRRCIITRLANPKRIGGAGWLGNGASGRTELSTWVCRQCRAFAKYMRPQNGGCETVWVDIRCLGIQAVKRDAT